MAVASPASATPPFAPDCKIAFTSRSCYALSMWSPVAGSEFIIVASIQRRRAQLIRLARRDRRPPVPPGGADIGHDGGDLITGKGLREGRHAVGHRIAFRAGRNPAVQNHSDRVHGRFHLD